MTNILINSPDSVYVDGLPVQKEDVRTMFYNVNTNFQKLWGYLGDGTDLPEEALSVTFATNAALTAGLAEKADTSHTHVVADITDITTTFYTETEIDALLLNKANTADLATVATSGSYTDLSNTPAGATFGQTEADLLYAALSHTHSIANITGLQNELDTILTETAAEALFEPKLTYITVAPGGSTNLTATPADKQIVRALFVGDFSSSVGTVGRNGKTIAGDAADFTYDGTKNVSVDFTYNLSEEDWSIG